MKSSLKIVLVVSLMLLVRCTVAQTGSQAAKSPGEETDFKAKEKEFWAQRDLFRKQAKAALDREMTREKAGDCPDARTTYDQNICLSKEIDATNANYKAYVGALRSLLGLKGPWKAAESGPTGKPLSEEETVKQFDEVEVMWQRYNKAQTSAVFDNYRGGTIAPIMAAACDLQLMRNHMRELDGIYDPMLWH